MNVKKTERGFARIDFIDRDDIDCSLQESSLATEAAIRLGCNDANPKQLVPGQGWTEIEMPKDYSANTRMHLTQQQVIDLLPHLAKFAATGEI